MDGLLQGADEYFTKPFHVNKLHQRLRNLLTRQQTLRAYFYPFTKLDTNVTEETVADLFLCEEYDKNSIQTFASLGNSAEYRSLKILDVTDASAYPS